MTTGFDKFSTSDRLQSQCQYAAGWLEMTRSWTGCLKGFLALIASLLLMTTSADANAPAPPSYFWMTFQGRDAKAVNVEGAQFVECATKTCDRPILLMNTGICTGEDCLKSSPILSAPHRFDCVQNTCLYAESQFSQRSTGPYYKLVAQFDDRTKTTPAFPLDLQNPLVGYPKRLSVTVQPDDLTIEVDRAPMKPTRWEMFGIALGLTQIAELSLAALCLWRLKIERLVMRILVAIAFINLLTFPVVWFFFPALQPFQYTTTRVFGVLSLLIAIGFSIFLATRSEITIRTLQKVFLVWLLSLPVVLAIGFVVAIFLGYGESLPPAMGVPSLITLPASEIFAVGWEAWLIDRLSQKRLIFAQVLTLSLLMNLVSLILGLVLLPAIQQFG
ncbi:hypothetical protein ACKFKF_15555 [Phormidesmis sp. 146-12]